MPQHRHSRPDPNALNDKKLANMRMNYGLLAKYVVSEYSNSACECSIISKMSPLILRQIHAVMSSSKYMSYTH